MSVLVVTPATWPISDLLADAKAHLKVEDDSEDALITDKLKTALEMLDGPDGELGYAVFTQTLQADFPCFADRLELPYPPFVSLTWVKYLDDAGVLQTVDPSVYETFKDEDRHFLRSRIGQSLPSLSPRTGRVTVQFVAGADDMPWRLKAALLLIVGDLMENREGATVGQSLAQIENPRVRDLLSPFRPAVIS